MSTRRSVIMLLRTLLLCLSLLHHLHLCFSLDTITYDRPIRDGTVLTSERGNFALGFFSPGKSSCRYVGIWYNKVSVQSVQTIAWVANRENPVNDSSGIFSIANDGNLILTARNITLWSTNVTASGPRSNGNKIKEARLLDSGNLVLVSGGGDSQEEAWQSFDHPTHNLLAGMKIGLDKKSGLNRFLTSWRSDDDPGRGNYSFQVDPNGSPQFFLYMDSKPLWRTGPWIGGKWSAVPDMTRSYKFLSEYTSHRHFINYSFVNTPDETVAVYYILNASIISTFMLDGSSGSVQRLTWLESTKRWTEFWAAPKDDCDYYAKCGVYGQCNPNSGNQFNCSCFPGYEPKSPKDWYLRVASDGCKRKREGNLTMCRNGEGFLKLSNVKVPDTVKASVDMSLSRLEECRNWCLKNCSCMGYTSANGADGGGCLAYFGELIDTMAYASGGQDVYFRVDHAELEKHYEKTKRYKWLVAGLSVSAALVAIGLASFLYRCWMKKTKEMEKQREILGWTKAYEENDNTDSYLALFDLSVIAAATNNFSAANKLGEGGFGSVYKGRLTSGQEIAVKRLGKNSGQGNQEFKNEVILIAKLQHRNLVKTLGCCVQGEEMMLIYEFLPNKSLDKFIFDEEKRSMLDWKKRYQIILGIARGIMYLHEDSRLRIIHRDLKASNVLLDAAMIPKVSDFGMARIFRGDQVEANTSRVVGTYGYMSPEYAMEGLFSVKSDVFSFGVLLLEIISGRKNVGFYRDNDSAVNLVGHVWELWQEGKPLSIVDPTIIADMDNNGNGDEELLVRCIQIGLLCVQENSTDRPSMSSVAFMLSNRTELAQPKKAAFVSNPSNNRTMSTTSDPSSSSTGLYSVNDVTASLIQGR